MSPTISNVAAAIWRGIREHHRLQPSLATVGDVEVFFPVEVTQARVDGTITVAAALLYAVRSILVVSVCVFFVVLDGNDFSRAIRDHVPVPNPPPSTTFTRRLVSS
jgi:predicted PurR-regulated permease PerM